nr:hypothetical protein [Tanacetum cinerariifolium]
MSTISSDSMTESVRSSASSVIATPPINAPPIALIVDSKSEPFEDPPNSKPFEDRISPVVIEDLEIGAEPLDSPDMSDFYGKSEFFEEDPSGDGPRKMVHLQPQLSLTTRAAIVEWAAAPPSPSPPPSPLSPLSSSSPPPLPAHSKPSPKRSHPLPFTICRTIFRVHGSPIATSYIVASIPIPISILILVVSIILVKYASCTLLDGALTWWNSYVKTVGIDAAYEISWKDLMKRMIEELALLCPKMVLDEEEKMKRYI